MLDLSWCSKWVQKFTKTLILMFQGLWVEICNKEKSFMSIKTEPSVKWNWQEMKEFCPVIKKLSKSWKGMLTKLNSLRQSGHFTLSGKSIAFWPTSHRYFTTWINPGIKIIFEVGWNLWTKFQNFFYKLYQ